MWALGRETESQIEAREMLVTACRSVATGVKMLKKVIAACFAGETEQIRRDGVWLLHLRERVRQMKGEGGKVGWKWLRRKCGVGDPRVCT